MKQKVMDAMQSFSRALMGPVLFLPIAGMLQAISSVMSNTALVTEGGVVWTLGKFINGGVGAVIGNLGVLFCVGIAMSLAKKRKADAAFLALVSYLVWLAANSRWLDVAGLTIAGDTASALYGTGQTICLGYHVTDMGVFLGMILGVVVALVHNRFIDTEFEGAMAMYGNSKFVFVVLLPIVLVMAVVASYVWPVAAAGINALTGVMASAGAFGVFLYGFLNRVLIPTGLHHLVWSPFLYSALGDSMIIGGEQVYMQLIRQCDRLFITKIFESFDADKHLMNVDKMRSFELVWTGDVQEENGIQYQFLEYRKKEKDLSNGKSQE